MTLFFDTETTGLPQSYTAPTSDSRNWPRMVQLACIMTDSNGQVREQRNFIIKPQGYTIPSDASAIHGITTDRAQREGVDLAVALSDFNDLVSQANTLVAHNMDFDEKIAGAEFYRIGMKDPLPAKDRLCTMKSPRVIAHCAIPPVRYGTYKWPKLGEMHYKLFGTNFQEAHNAAVDIQATVRCFWELRRLGIV